MEEQSQDRHDRQEIQAEIQQEQRPYRTPKERVISSLKARGLGYVLIAVLLICSYPSLIVLNF